MRREFEISKLKFQNLLTGEGEFDIELKLDYFVKNVKPIYAGQEWGFPKGRRTRNETELECAMREFSEETGIDKNDIKIIDKIKPIHEIMTGTNGIKYRHIYYVAETVKEMSGNIMEKINELKEVSHVDFFNFYDAYGLIRDYHVEKKNILTCLFMYYIENILDSEGTKSIETILTSK
jgi:8-oxo-dGTP pyrophosphatase MutT (NUDIX family)